MATGMQKNLKPVPLSGFRADTVTDFDIYLVPRPDAEAVLYREKAMPFTAEILDRLVQNKVEAVFIDASQEHAYNKYMEANLTSIIHDPSVPVARKSELLYSSVQNLMAEMMADPRSGDMIDRSKAVVENTVDFLMAEPAAFENLLNMVSFDYYTYTHSVNVLFFSVALAQRAGYDDPGILRAYGDGLLLHDIGKSHIDPAIVNCRGKLSPEQWQIMKTHPAEGAAILQSHGNVPEVALDVVRHHHEKLTGSGYPDGLKGTEISQFVRICTIADIFDALTTQRSYKDALPSFPALKLMREEMSDEIDPALFGLFVGMMGNPGGR